jgi:hypothetical protein
MRIDCDTFKNQVRLSPTLVFFFFFFCSEPDIGKQLAKRRLLTDLALQAHHLTVDSFTGSDWFSPHPSHLAVTAFETPV